MCDLRRDHSESGQFFIVPQRLFAREDTRVEARVLNGQCSNLSERLEDFTLFVIKTVRLFGIGNDNANDLVSKNDRRCEHGDKALPL